MSTLLTNLESLPFTSLTSGLGLVRAILPMAALAFPCLPLSRLSSQG